MTNAPGGDSGNPSVATPAQPPAAVATFDTSVLVEALQDASLSSSRYCEVFDAGTEAIHRMFEAGASTRELLSANSALTDLILQHIWAAEGEVFDSCALAAVGGYGRGELYPGSDIDVCILVPPIVDAALEERLIAWVARLWDLRRDIGHSVRSIIDCEREAQADITVVTNLMEARLLCGSSRLFDLMQRAVSTDRMWSSAEFFEAKMREQNDRRQKFQTNAYRLEPNVKESDGGLRDIQMISWVCQREFGTHSLDDLVTRDLLNEIEYAALREGLELIGRVRYLLHRLARRREDRLLFDFQRDIAHAFGYTDDNDNRSIEQLMQRYYRSVTEMQRLNEILLQGVGGIISGVTAAAAVLPINKRFQLRNGYLEVTHRDVFIHYPPALLEVFLVFGDTPDAKNVRANTVRLIRSHLPLINDRFRSDPVVRTLFLQIFRNPNKLTRKIRMMNRYGVLAAYLPAFDAIVGRMQYDLFHIFTVDEHTFRVIRNLRRMALPAFYHETPQCQGLMSDIARPELLYIAALFHDIAKGRGGDHSELGAVDAEVFCSQHGLTSDETGLISWVVRHHLLMSITAQRKDISDPDVQHSFARQVGTLERLRHLYLLTIADIRATNPELWNSFKGSLLNSLFHSACTLLEQGLDNPPDRADLIAQRQREAAEILSHSIIDIDDARLADLFNGLGDEYFQQYDADEIARHCELIIANDDTPGPLVSMRRSESRGSMELLVYTPDDDALFALITTVLGQLQLKVLSATINTTDKCSAMDTFHVLEMDGSLIEDEWRILEIKRALQYELGVPHDIPTLVAPRASRQLKHFSIPSRIEFATVEGSGFTEVRITAADRPGILSSIARTFLRAGVSVHAARVATLGERIDDIFFVRAADGQPIDDEASRARLTQMLLDRL